MQPIRTLVAIFVLALSVPAQALPPQPQIPDVLLPWTAWVLETHRDLLCAQVGSERKCDWPGRLSVQIGADNGKFELDVWLDARTTVALPGDATTWPQHVAVDAQPAVIQLENDLPHLDLAKGHHKVTGNWQWAHPPELLAVPDAIGLVELALGDTKVEWPRRDEQGRLFLQQDGGKNTAEIDTLTVTVARKLVDGVPLKVTTRLTLRVAGRARELLVGPVLLAGSRPTALRSGVATQVGSDGAVRVHGTPGQHIIDIDAVLPLPLLELPLPQLQGEFFEKQEVWLWLPNEALRSIELTGLQSIDPERTQLDPDWKKAGRTYVGTAGQKLLLQQTRRGESEPPPNHLMIKRELWLDEAGSSWIARDCIEGEMHKDWRLNAGDGSDLGRVGGPKGATSLLITKDAVTGKNGVELRDGKVNLEADSKVNGVSSDWPIVGWDFDVQKLSATLHLPPGWRLLGGSGVDEMPQTWLDSWTLFDFFFVLMLALGAGKLLGWRWAIVAMFGLALCHGEEDAPQMLWINALAALALVRALPPSWFRRVVALYHVLAMVLLVSALLPFARDQIRHGIYPQVAQGGKAPLSIGYATRAAAVDTRTANADLQMEDKEKAPAAPPVAAAVDAPSEKAALKKADLAPSPSGGKGEMAQSQRGGGEYWSSARNLKQIDPAAVVQTGPGVPSWTWTDLQLNWTGPVGKDHKISLWLLSPKINLLLAVLRVLLAVVLGLRLLDWQLLRTWFRRIVGPPVAVSALLLLVFMPQAHAVDWAPSAEMLQTLEKRLTDAQNCEGSCVVANLLTIDVRGQDIVLTADISAQRDGSWAIPGPYDPLQIRQVLIDGQPTQQLRRLANGLVAVRVPVGPHNVVIKGLLPRRNVLTLQLDPLGLPKQVKFSATEWQIDGLQDNGQVRDSLQLTRNSKPADLAQPATSGEQDAETNSELPPWFSVSRNLQLGMPWQVHTVVTREGASRPHLLKLPLLSGEAVITPGVKVENGEGADSKLRYVVLQFARDVASLEYDSELPIAANLTLKAPASPQVMPWTEVWSLACSAIWRCDFKGLQPVHTRDPQTQQLQPQWQPWPGETLEISVVKPKGAQGQAVTIDRADYKVTAGQRLLQATLTLSLRTSQGGWQKLTLPEGARVQSVTLNGQARTIRPQGRILQLPLEPGAQEIVVLWQQESQRGVHESVPPLDLGSPAANVQITLDLGEDRWLLWAQGPPWGPAILFWSHLALLLLGAVLLGRMKHLPLHTGGWLLLSLGVANLPVFAAGVIMTWFVALGWRRKYGDGGDFFPAMQHNFMQLCFGGLTLAFLIALYAAIQENLLAHIDMQVSGAGSTQQVLHWYVGRSPAALPESSVISVSLNVWRYAMLAWALWLVVALLKWLPWAWKAFSSGPLWLKAPPKPLRHMPIVAPSSVAPFVEPAMGPPPPPPPRPPVPPPVEKLGD